MKKTLFFIFCLLTLSLSSQDIKFDALSNGGGSINNLNKVNFTVGQPIVGTITDGVNSIRQGFQQPSFNIYGCTDSTQFNYDPLANTDDGSCVPFVYGCTDSSYSNFNVNANTDDGTCANFTYVPDDEFESHLISLGLDSYPLNDSVLTSAIDTVSSLFMNNLSITDLTGIEDFSNLQELTAEINSISSVDLSANIQLVYLNMQFNSLTGNLDLSNNSSVEYVKLRSNQLSSITFENDTTIEYLNLMDNQFSQLNLDNLTSLKNIIVTNNNIDSLDFSSCSSIKFISINQNNLSYLNLKNGLNNNISYLTTVNNPNLYCIEVDDAVYSTNNWNNIDSWTSFSGNCQLVGCIDTTAYNFNPNAWINDSCCYIAGCTDITMYNYDSSACFYDGSCIPFVYGCIDSTQFNFDPLANTDDGTCISFIYGCTDSTQFNFDPLANTDNGSCIPFIYGCTDFTMFNYDSLANTDDSTCIPYIYGCTDSLALNFNNLANTDDSSCCGAGLSLPLFGTLIGQEITGSSYGDQLGKNSINNQGDILAVGIPGYQSDKGAVKVFKLQNNTWNQIGPTLIGDQNGERFGEVSLNGLGNIIAVSSPFFDTVYQNVGKVSIFQNISNNWIQIGNSIYGESAYEKIGIYSSISINETGDIFVVGAVNNQGIGSARIYELINNIWVKTADISNPSVLSFGKSVDINSNGDVVAIGNWTETVEIWHKINNVWQIKGQQLIGTNTGHWGGPNGFGFSVSLNSSGNIIAIGARTDTVNGVGTGKALVYEFNGNSWTQIGQDIDGIASGDQFGQSISINGAGNIIAVGANGALNGAGQVRIFEYTNGNWLQSNNNIDGTIYSNTISSYFGWPVSLNKNGNILASGASSYNNIKGQVLVISINTDTTQYTSPPCSGCTDSLAVNYDPYSLIDDSSCAYAGCMDSTATNYDPSVVADDGSCIPFIYGCTDSLALNFDPLVNTDDGSCCGAEIPIPFGTQLGQTFYESNLGFMRNKLSDISYDGNRIAIAMQDLNEVIVMQWDGVTWQPVGSPIIFTNPQKVSISGNGNVVAVGDNVSFEIYENSLGSWNFMYSSTGFLTTSQLALNYNGYSLALGGETEVRVYRKVNGWFNDVILSLGGATSTSGNPIGYSIDIDSIGNTIVCGRENVITSQPGKVKVFERIGYMNWNQKGSDIFSTTNSFSFGYDVSISSDGNTIVGGGYRNSGMAGGIDACGGISLAGHVEVYEYNSSVSWTQIGTTICGSFSGNYMTRVSLSANGNKLVISPQSSIYSPPKCYEKVSGSWTDIWSGDSTGVGTISGSGNIVLTESGLQSGPYVRAFSLGAIQLSPPCSGCTDSLAVNYDPYSLIDDGSCAYAGCMDSTATNYDPSAVADDGSCIPFIYGCTDSLALNFDPLANTDDGSCCGDSLTISFGTQIGMDIDGLGIGDQFGYATSISNDGKIIAIGSPDETTSVGLNSGAVRIFKNINGAWFQIGQDIYGEAASDHSGWSVSLNDDGTIVAIGAQYNDDNGPESGHVRVYEYDNTSWVQLGQDIDGESSGDQSGKSVSLSSDGNVLAIGAYKNDGISGVNSGQVRVYTYNGSSWVQIGQDVDGAANGDHFGWDVSMNHDGSIFAASSPYHSGLGQGSAGHVRVYINANGVWSQVGNDIYGAVDWDRSGWSISLSKQSSIHNYTIAIGSIDNDGGSSTNNERGHVRVFNNPGNGVWTQVGQDIIGEAYWDHSGYKVSISDDGTKVAIGAHQNDGGGNASGHVRIYEDVNGSWSQVGYDIDGEAIDDESGSSVSLSGDGNTVAIGAHQNDSNSGHVRVFNVGTGTMYTSPPCSGCTDSLAVNYDPYSLIDDGSCITPIYGCMDSLALNYNTYANVDNNTCYYCSITSSVISWFSSSLSACNGFISVTPTSGSSPYTYVWSNGNTTSLNLNLCDGSYSYTVIDANGCGFTEIIILTNYVGCTDSTALNYDSTAIVDDGSCINFIYGCTDSTSMNYNSLANTDDGSCAPYIYGCTDSTAINYDLIANTDDGSCTYCYALANIGADTITACDSVVLSTNTIAGGSYLWNSSNTVNSVTPPIGDFYQGGVVFWIDPNDSTRGMVMDIFALPAAEWGCYNYNVGAYGFNLGTGQLNTQQIINSNCVSYWGSNSIAAELCDSSTNAGYSDWFLPSVNDYVEIASLAPLLDNYILNYGGGYYTY